MKRYTPFLLIGLILFIVAGDNLPEPLGKASKQIHNYANNFFVGLFPTGRPSVKPYQRTEKAVEQMERTAK